MQYNLRHVFLAVGLAACATAMIACQSKLVVAFVLMVGIGATCAGGISREPGAWKRGAVCGLLSGTAGLLAAFVLLGLWRDTLEIVNPVSAGLACGGAAAGGLCVGWQPKLAVLCRAWRWSILGTGAFCALVAAICLTLQIRSAPASHDYELIDELVGLGAHVFCQETDRSTGNWPPHGGNRLWEPWRRRLGLRRLPTRVWVIEGRNSRELLPALAALPGLKELRFCGNGIRDDDLRCLASATELEMLDLSGNRVTDQGVGHLAAIPHLKRLVLAGNRITDEGLGGLAGLRQLRELDLSCTFISRAGAGQLHSQLPDAQIFCDLMPTGSPGSETQRMTGTRVPMPEQSARVSAWEASPSP